MARCRYNQHKESAPGFKSYLLAADGTTRSGGGLVRLRARPELTTRFGPGSRPFGTRTPGMYYTKTRRPFDTLVFVSHEAISTPPFSRCPFNTLLPSLLPSFLLPSSLITPFLSSAQPHPTPSHMKKKQHHVYPPFPSFAWVLTTQANPPTPAYAYGYVQSVHAHNGPRPRLPAFHAPPRVHHKARPRSKRPPSSSKRVKAAAHDEKLMVCR